VCSQGGEKPAVRQGYGMATTEHYQVNTLQAMAILAEAFAHNAFQAAPVNGSPSVFL